MRIGLMSDIPDQPIMRGIENIMQGDRQFDDPQTSPGGPPGPAVIVGLARWASRLPPDARYQAEVVREWRALKGIFPRQPGFWRSRL